MYVNTILVLLCSIGLIFLQQVMNRRQKDRHRIVLQAFAFFYEYARQRQGSFGTENQQVLNSKITLQQKLKQQPPFAGGSVQFG